MDEWRRLVIHLAVGGFHQAAAFTPLFFAALQRRHLLRLNLHSIQFFYLHPKKKGPEDPPQQLAPPGGLNQTARCQGRGRALIRQTPPLMHRRGELVPPHHPPLPLPDAHPTVRVFLPKDFPAQHRICKPRRGWGVVVEGPRGSATAAPSSAPAPSGTDAQPREGSQAGASLWRTDQGGRLSHRAPGWRRRGVAAFVRRNLLPLWKKLEVRSERQGRPGLGKVRGGRGSPTPPISLNLTQKGDAKCTKFACGRWCATPMGSQRAAAKGKELGVRKGRGAGDEKGR